MSSKSSSGGRRRHRHIDRGCREAPAFAGLFSILWLAACTPAEAGDAPDWMHTLVNVPLPAHSDTTKAVLLYSDEVVSVRPDGRLRTHVRKAYRILRPEGADLGQVVVGFDSQSRITDLHGWCIPANGKDLMVKEKDSAETALPGIANGYVISDLRARVMRIPAAVPGSVIGYEVEQEQPPYLFNTEWDPQETIPVREARYTVQLPAGWSQTPRWINHGEVTPVESNSGGMRQWQWSLRDLPAVPVEEQMPPWRGIAARMVVSLAQANGRPSGWNTWQDLGNWHLALLGNRREPSAGIRAKVAALTAAETTSLAKIRAVARFVQSDIRYVAIELGIGGYQPHPAADVFAHRYGDCKDKATLLSSMLQVIGVDSFPVLINTTRGTVLPDMPANQAFNHAILAIRLPAGTQDPGLLALVKNPQFGELLFFDPTDPLTPLGRLAGNLQANYGLIVGPGRSELVRLPQLPAETSGVRRTAQMLLDEKGTLSGEIDEIRVGDAAQYERERLHAMPLDTDRIKPIEARVANSLSTFRITKAAVGSVDNPDRPFEWRYSLEAENYARAAGDLLIVRPRIVGSLARGFLETDEARRQPIEFEGPERNTDVFEIELPAHYTVEELPPAVNVEYEFASYQSRTEMVGGKLRYSRSFEIRELSVPASKGVELRHLYRTIADDERSSAVLRKAGS